jgi:hypothetical protein
MKSCCWTSAAKNHKSRALITHEEQVFIQAAFNFLDHPGFLVRVANMLGKPVGAVIESLPQKQKKLIQKATHSALRRGLEVVTGTVSTQPLVHEFSEMQRRNRWTGHWHSLASFGVGAAGGLFGAVMLPVELPVTTAIMLRSIAKIAHESGMNLQDPHVQMECLYILSLGASESLHRTSNYWASRIAFAQMSREAAGFLANKTAKEVLREIENRAAPLLMRFMAAVASRFEVVVSEKLMAEALPVVGAIGGGVINAAFTEYFSDAARYHFGLRALENRHGRAAVEQYYHHDTGVA